MIRNDPERDRPPPSAERVFQQFLRRREHDPTLCIEDYCSKYPDLSSALRDLLQALPPSTLSETLSLKTTTLGSTAKGSTAKGSMAKDGDGASLGAIPRQVGRYRLLHEIGRGGMGVVYLAEDTRLHRRVALKLLPDAYSGDQTWLLRFEREAQTTAQLSHLNIATVYDLGQSDDGLVFIAMEYVVGRTLRDELVAHSPLPMDDLLSIAIQILEGMREAHRHDVVHRDLKPSNIMLSDDQCVKILDFGLAKTLEACGDDSDPQLLELTREGELLGTVTHMSPEQARGLPVDARSDLFAFGTIFYEMATGTSPFRRTTLADTLVAIVSESPRPISEVNPTLPKALDRISEELLAKDVDARYPSSERVLGDLRKVLHNWETGHRETGHELPAVGSQPRPKSIAVLPFINMSSDAENEYFTDGLAEELINSLTRIKELQVASRTSTFAYKGKAADVRTIGRELNVATVLEGSVRRSGNRLRITAQLIDVSDGYHLWSERFDRVLEDVFAVQDEIAHTIVDTLEVAVVGKPRAPLIRRYTENLEAYQLYLKGRYFWNKRFEGLLQKGIECFYRAIELDPNYALAYAGLADSYIILGTYAYFPVEEAISRARAAAQRAVEIDDTLAEAHVSLGMAQFGVNPDYASALGEFRRAIELKPNESISHSWFGMASALLGHSEEARAAARRSQEIDALAPLVHSTAALTLYWCGLLDEGREQCRKGLDLDPEHPTALWVEGTLHMAKGDFTGAISPFRRLVELTNRGGFYVSNLGAALGAAGHHAEARDLAEQLEVRRAGEYISPLYLGWVYLGLGEHERAADLFEKARGEGSFFFWLPRDPLFDPIREDSRFRAYFEHMRLPV